MAILIPKKEVNKMVKDFLKEIKKKVRDDYLVWQVKEDKIVVQSLKKWLEERKK